MRTVVLAAVAAVAIWGAGGWAFGSAGVAQRAGFVRFDIFEIADQGPAWIGSVSTFTDPGESFGKTAPNCGSLFVYVVCEDDADSVNPCGPGGPAPDANGDVSVLWDTKGRVVGQWTPPSERKGDS